MNNNIRNTNLNNRVGSVDTSVWNTHKCFMRISLIFQNKNIRNTNLIIRAGSVDTSVWNTHKCFMRQGSQNKSHIPE